MPNANPRANAYAAVLAASSAIASKRAYRRGAPPTGLPAHLQLPSLPDVPSLFADAPAEDTNELRVVRVTTASLLYALKTNGYAERILNKRERKRLEALDAEREREHALRKSLKTQPGRAKLERSCLYCRLFHNAIYDGVPPQALVVNHRAHVVSDFDPVTNIAEAGIEGYQVLVPENIAPTMVGSFHPLRWPDFANEIFQQTDEAFRPAPGKLWTKPEPVTGGRREDVIERWQDESDHYLYEDVEMPWNGQVKSVIRNILKISEFTDVSEDTFRSLGFRFSLESCLESNLGIRLERGGLDIDGGSHFGSAERWPDEGLPDTLGNLSVRDLAHVRNLLGHRHGPQIEHLGDDSGPATELEKLDTLTDAVSDLRARWRQQPWLITLSTSKRLRHTAPASMPLSLWTALTWMAPAQLFLFINRVVTQAHIGGLDLAASDSEILTHQSGMRPPPWLDIETLPADIPLNDALPESKTLAPRGKRKVSEDP